MLRVPLMTVLVILAVGLISLASAKGEKEKVYAPLPKKILEAKTVALDNQTGNLGLGDKAYEGLIKWGRFRVIDRSENPDLLIVLFKERHQGDTVIQGEVKEVPVIGGTQPTRHEVSGVASSPESWVSYLSVVDPLTGGLLWRAPWDAEQRKSLKGRWARTLYGTEYGGGAGYKSALEVLKERIEIQEKSAR